MLATAVSARVDIFRLTNNQVNQIQEDQGISLSNHLHMIIDEEADQEVMKPTQKINKFKDFVSAVKLRQDGNIVLCGEKTGRIQLIELSNKFILKTYEEHQK